MNTEFHIECSWLGRENGSEEDRAFYAEIGISVGDEWLTQLEDLTARTVRKHMRGSGYQLAQWFAANWWRLRHEPAFEGSNNDVDWRIAHCMAAAGGGYVWPDVLFTSDGASLEVEASAWCSVGMRARSIPAWPSGAHPGYRIRAESGCVCRRCTLEDAQFWNGGNESL